MQCISFWRSALLRTAPCAVRSQELPSALECYTRALAIREKALGPNAREVGITLANMAVRTRGLRLRGSAAQ